MHPAIAMVAAALALAASSCSPSTQELSASTSAETFTFSDNYQEIYRRLSTSAKKCAHGNVGASSSFEVDAELYNELGYGEVTFSVLNLGVRNYYWSAKIEKAPTGTKVTYNVGNTLNPAGYRSEVVRWLSGNTSCF